MDLFIPNYQKNGLYTELEASGIDKITANNSISIILKCFTKLCFLIKTIKYMKEKILSIASDLKEGFISTKEAQNLLLNLLGVSESTCNNFHSDPFVNEYKCLNCGKMKTEH